MSAQTPPPPPTMSELRASSGGGSQVAGPLSFGGASNVRWSELLSPASIPLSATLSHHRLPHSPASRVIKRFASEDFDLMRSSMRLFPLRFVNSNDERRFFNKVIKTFHIRARIAAVVSCTLLLALWITSALCVRHHAFPVASKRSEIMFSVCMGGALISAIIPYFASMIAFCQRHLEALLYMSVLSIAFLIGFWIVFNATEETSNNVLAIIQFQRTKVWVNVFIYILPFWCCILMDIILQARTKTSFMVHALNTTMFAAANAIQTAIFIQKAHKSAAINTSQNEFLIVITLLDCIFTLSICSLLFLGRWFLELQERIEFLRRMKAVEQIRRLKEANAKKRPKKGATVIEEVLTLVERVIATIGEVLVESKLPSLAEGGELLKQCHQILTDTDNLYSVRYRSKGQNEEEEVMEEQFFQIYADKQLARLPTRVRFGEVTGIQFDAEAATQDISRSGQLEKPAALRSFCLLTLLHDPQQKQQGLIPLAPAPLLPQTELLRIGRDWETDILLLYKTYDNILLEVGAALLSQKVEYIRCSRQCLFNYLYALQNCYLANPYHNKCHGATVAHATSCFMKMLYIYEATDHTIINDIAVIVAALGHDAGHPARNNQFFINSFDNLALLYNDASVLENVHSAVTFKCLEAPGANIFGDVSPETFRGARKRIIELILATDMGQHFETVSRFRLRRQAAGFNYLRDLDDMWLVLRMCIKCADLSHALVDWSQHLDWSLRVAEEFYQQGDNEAALGLTVSPLCDRSQHSGFAKSQKGFLEFVVEPLVTQLQELSPGGPIEVECGRRLIYNKFRWEKWSQEQYAPPMPEEYQKMPTRSFACLETLVRLFAKGHRLVPLGSKTAPTAAALTASGGGEDDDIQGDKSLMRDETQFKAESSGSLSTAVRGDDDSQPGHQDSGTLT